MLLVREDTSPNIAKKSYIEKKDKILKKMKIKKKKKGVWSCWDLEMANYLAWDLNKIQSAQINDEQNNRTKEEKT